MTATAIHLDLPDLAATGRLGVRLGGLLRPGDVILLAGPLGAGKTTITQAIGRGAGVPPSCYITSPTFALAHEYPGRLPLCHLDLYRLGSEDEIEELGFGEMLYGRGAAIVEWPDRLGSLKPEGCLEVTLEFAGEGGRRATLLSSGGQWDDRLAALAGDAGEPRTS